MREADILFSELKVRLKFMESNHVTKRGTWGPAFQLVRISIPKIRTHIYFNCLKLSWGNNHLQRFANTYLNAKLLSIEKLNFFMSLFQNHEKLSSFRHLISELLEV